jgi:hypothetical protein
MVALLNFKAAILFDHSGDKLSLEDTYSLDQVWWGAETACVIDLMLMHTTIYGRAQASKQEDTVYWNTGKESK